MGNVKVAAIRGRYKGTRFFQFVIDPNTMARLGFVQHRARLDRMGEMTYQRLIQKNRMKAISRYINEDQVFPTNIVVNFHGSKSLKFEPAEKSQQVSDELTFGRLTLPSSFKSAWIIDGQHRLFSYFRN